MPKLRSVIGLDLGRHSVKVVRAVPRGKSVSITHAEILPLPGGQPDAAEVVGNWLAKLGLTRTPCVLSLSGQSAMFQPMSLAPDDPRTLSQAVSVEIARFNELAQEDMVYSFCPLSPAADEKSLLLAMARPAVLMHLLHTYREAGLDVVDIVPAPAAAFNALAPALAPAGPPTLIADIGYSATQIAVGTGGGMMFARALGSGGLVFAEALAKATNRSPRQAEQLLAEEAPFTSADPAVQAAMRKAVDSWLAELASCLSVYRSAYPQEDRQPASIILCGGVCRTRGLPQYIEKTAGLPVVVPDDLGTRFPADADPLRFAAAAGLAMAGLDRGATDLSLLPPHVRQELALRWQKGYWIAAGGVAALILAASLAGGYWDFKRQEKYLRKKSASLERCEQVARQIDRIKEDNFRLKEMEGPMLKLIANGPLMRDFFGLLAQAKDRDDVIAAVTDATLYQARGSAYEALRAVLEPPKPKNRSRRNRGVADAEPEEEREDCALRNLIVEGYTPHHNLATVQKLIMKLNAEPGITADLLGDDKIIANEERDLTLERKGARRFVLEVRCSDAAFHPSRYPGAGTPKPETAVRQPPAGGPDASGETAADART